MVAFTEDVVGLAILFLVHALGTTGVRSCPSRFLRTANLPTLLYSAVRVFPTAGHPAQVIDEGARALVVPGIPLLNIHRIANFHAPASGQAPLGLKLRNSRRRWDGIANVPEYLLIVYQNTTRELALGVFGVLEGRGTRRLLD